MVLLTITSRRQVLITKSVWFITALRVLAKRNGIRWLNMRHTNGPWFCDGNFVRHVDTSKLIAEVYISPTSQNGNIMADSRLIASAPDLLEALYSALDLIKNELG